MNRKVAFIGSGLIGSGLGVNCAMHGMDVVLQTRSQIERCKKLVVSALDLFVEKGILDEAGKQLALSHCSYTTSIEKAVSGADFIQESGPESMELKQDIIAQIEQYAREDAIIASSTSGLSITGIFSKSKHPERGVGGHPYNPSYILPLVEVTRGEQTSEENLQRACAFYKELGKEPVILNKEISGFIANRFQRAIHREVVELVSKGVCSVEDADKAMVYSVGLRWGVIGQFMTLHLGVSPDGIGKFNEKYHIDPTKEDRGLATLADWTTFPENWTQLAQKGIEEELAHRDPAIGQDDASVEAWRDRMMIDMLKLHGKF